MAIVNELPSNVGMKKELLWTNPNPNSSFTAQNITFPNGLSAYQYFLVEAKGHISNVLSNVIAYSMSPAQFTYAIIAVGGTYNVRQLSPITNGIKIEGAKSSGTGTIDNSYTIPLRIYGVKGEIR